MRRLYLAVMLVALSLTLAGETGAHRRTELAKLDQSASCLEAAAGDVVAQQACCKANKGVCGCRAGKIVCCDKTFSDTCTCNRDEAPDGVH